MTAVGKSCAARLTVKFADAESRSDPEIPPPEILRLGVACAGVRGVSVHAVPRLSRAQRVRGPPLRAAGAHLCPAARAACRAAHCAAGRGAGIARSRLPRRAARRRVRLVRAQRQRTGDRAAAVRVLGRAPAGEAPARGVRRRCGHGAARRRGRGAAARAPGAVADRRHLPGEQRGPGAGQARRGAATFRAGPDRHRGPPVLLPQRLRPARPRARGAEPRVRQGPGRQHAHPAARQKLLPDSGAYAAARATELGVTRKPAMGTSPYPAFLRLVHRQMRRDYDEADLRSEGLRIFTTLDPRVQRAAESALIRRLAQFDKEHRFGEPGLEGAVVVTDPQSGEVQALVGATDLSPLEVAQMYQTIASGGWRAPLRSIREVTTQEGRPLQRYPLAVEQAFAPEPMYLLTAAMQDVVREGTAQGLKNFLPPELAVAGKTGTTDEQRDAWFAGFTGDRLGVVWIGYDDNRAARLTGAGAAVPVWGEMMAALAPEPLALAKPDRIELVWIDPQTGLRGSMSCEGPRAPTPRRAGLPMPRQLWSGRCESSRATRACGTSWRACG